jgi:hypothetical protein
MRRSHLVFGGLGAAVLSVAATVPAQATITQISSAADLGSATTVDWAIFGPVPSTVSTFAEEQVGPLSVHINTASGQLNLETGSTVGGFLPADTLLSQLPGNLSDPIQVGFSAPVRGVGTQIESLLSGPFTGIMDLFDTSGTLLGEVTVDATTTTDSDGSAPFIGAISDSEDISFVTFAVNNGNPTFPEAGDVAINALLFEAPVPEPATLALFGAALAGLGAIRGRKGR